MDVKLILFAKKLNISCHDFWYIKKCYFLSANIFYHLIFIYIYTYTYNINRKSNRKSQIQVVPENNILPEFYIVLAILKYLRLLELALQFLNFNTLFAMMILQLTLQPIIVVILNDIPFSSKIFYDLNNDKCKILTKICGCIFHKYRCVEQK